jgi:hypothetical protein
MESLSQVAEVQLRREEVFLHGLLVSLLGMFALRVVMASCSRLMSFTNLFYRYRIEIPPFPHTIS